MANRNYASAGKVYSGHVKPVHIDCQFTVTSTNGLGITGLTGAYVQNVFMHTSTTPAVGNSNPATPNVAVTNPNPANGTIIVQLQDNYNRAYINGYSVVSPLGTPVKIDNSEMTAGVAYVITTLGNATAAKWRAIGVPAGVTPAVGVAFIAASNGGAGNTLTSRVAPSATAGSGITVIEQIGSLPAMLNPNPTAAQGFGAQIILQCRTIGGTSSALTFTGTPATLTGTNSAPALTMNSYTPAGSVAAGVIPVTAGTAGDAVTNNGGVLESTGGQDLTVNAQAFTGTPATLTGSVAAPTLTMNSYTPAGTINTPALTVASAIAAPVDGTVISLSFLLSDSSILVGGA